MQGSNWPIEPIPNEHDVYFRVHKNYIVNDGPYMFKPRAFVERGDKADQHKSMSTNWEEYSTPEQTQSEAKIPMDNGVVAMSVGGLRSENLTVNHAPIPTIRAHTDVNGLPDDIKDVEVRVKLFKHCRWVINPELSTNP
ncbi:hypothetical protein [Fibrella aquatilis]|uniref:Uncharacterized protein n=1 Tax=Fibrella aquatilis TaxID=2817059 RepID=A0A939G9S2_9BACT|nr:hypothetical protein [Fibrella aquatilis]MBO0932717.1 hypothetical protein [Fibrella aquatilis]